MPHILISCKKSDPQKLEQLIRERDDIIEFKENGIQACFHPPQSAPYLLIKNINLQDFKANYCGVRFKVVQPRDLSRVISHNHAGFYKIKSFVCSWNKNPADVSDQQPIDLEESKQKRQKIRLT